MDGTRVVRIEIDSQRRRARRSLGLTSCRCRRCVGRRVARRAQHDRPRERGQRARRSCHAPRELYQNGVISASRKTPMRRPIDKWEAYREGQLTQVSLDLQGKGVRRSAPDVRTDGSVRRVEADPDGDGASRRCRRVLVGAAQEAQADELTSTIVGGQSSPS
jgi:hypothetical protein